MVAKMTQIRTPKTNGKSGYGDVWPATQLSEGDCMGTQHGMTAIPKSASYSIGTNSSLLQGDDIPDKPIPVRSSRQQFRPDIEGMRAIAVGLVILFHAYHTLFTGGFVGVDVFFVIS